MAGIPRQVIRSLASVALALALGVGPLLTELCEARCALPAAAGSPASHHAIHHDGCPQPSEGAAVVVPVPPHRCQTRDVNAAMSRPLDWSSIPLVLSTSLLTRTTLNRSASLFRVDSRHGPPGSPSATTQLRI